MCFSKDFKICRISCFFQFFLFVVYKLNKTLFKPKSESISAQWYNHQASSNCSVVAAGVDTSSAGTSLLSKSPSGVAAGESVGSAGSSALLSGGESASSMAAGAVESGLETLHDIFGSMDGDWGSELDTLSGNEHASKKCDILEHFCFDYNLLICSLKNTLSCLAYSFVTYYR